MVLQLLLVVLVYMLIFMFGGDVLFFFVKQKTAYEMRISDWSSDVCSSDLEGVGLLLQLAIEIPAVALVGAAADVGDGVDEAAVDEAEAVGREGRARKSVV